MTEQDNNWSSSENDGVKKNRRNRKAVNMSRLVKVFVLAQVLANAACEPPVGVEPERSIPVSLDAMKGTWDYAASFVTATTSVKGDSATCEIAGVAITVGDPHGSEILGGGWPYSFDAEASGATLGCTGDGIEGFVQDLAPTPVELVVGVLWFSFDFTISTPLGSMRLDHTGIQRPTQSPWVRR